MLILEGVPDSSEDDNSRTGASDDSFNGDVAADQRPTLQEVRKDPVAIPCPCSVHLCQL